MRAILLAAGRSTRFGADKLLHPLDDGTPMALAAARNLAAALPEVLAVVNGESLELIAGLERAGLAVTICPHAAQGMGASLAWSVAQSRLADGWLIALADMPWIRPETIRAVAAAASPDAIVAPVHQGRRGHPVAFGRNYQEELTGLSGDTGARRLFEVHAAHVVLVPCDDEGVLLDIDFREQTGR